MINKSLLKEVIISNKEFILSSVRTIIEREKHITGRLNKVVVLFGVRRSGKTFILFDLFKKFADNALYIDFEDDRLIDFQLQDFNHLKDVFLEFNTGLVGRELVFLFDEVQNIEGWEKFCRRAVERENIKVFVSGSSSKIMPAEIHTELRGRAWSIEVMPFSFAEYIYAKGVDIGKKSVIYGAKKIVLKKLFMEYMRWGGFPEVSILDSELEKTKLLKEYMSAMFFRDMVERYRISNIILLENLNDTLFSSFSLKFSLTSFYKRYRDKFPLSKDLLFRYYKYFMQSMLIFEVRKFAESSYVRMRNPAKLYLVDTGLSKRVTSADSGRLLENIIYMELRRRNYEIYYFEGKNECDFILKTEAKGWDAMQVCFELSNENLEREIAGLVEACKWLDLREGMILTYDDERETTASNITIKIIPAWKWLLLKEGEAGSKERLGD